MATTAEAIATTQPHIAEIPGAAKTAPLVLTTSAIAKVREIMATQDPLPAGLRIGVVGGGCSGFQYSMSFENQQGMMDKVFPFEDMKVFVDATSLMYLNGCVVDYVETLEAAGFKFENPEHQEHLRLRIFFQRLALRALRSWTKRNWKALPPCGRVLFRLPQCW